MADPTRTFFQFPGDRPSQRASANPTEKVMRQQALEQSIQIIAKHELRIWFEPCWEDARLLAARFPHCVICSIPTESDTVNRTRVPGWRARRNGGVI